MPLTQLYFGPYSMPSGYSVGDMIRCEYRGHEVEIGGITDAPIAWFRVPLRGSPSVILCGDLVRAVKAESSNAVSANWGVSIDTVRKWRRILGVGRMTKGTTIVWRQLFPLHINAEAAEHGRKKSQSPESRKKMIATKSGKAMHKNTRKALLRALKKPKTEAHREAISLAHRARGTIPPNGGRVWTEAEDQRLGKATDAVIAKELNRSPISVKKRRYQLSVARFKKTQSD